jgi:hypothetical protein
MTEKPASTWEGLCDFVRQEMEKTSVPGLALGVLYQGQGSGTRRTVISPIITETQVFSRIS